MSASDVLRQIQENDVNLVSRKPVSQFWRISAASILLAVVTAASVHAPIAVAGKVYRTTDAQGNIIFTDLRRDGAETVIDTPSRPSQAEANVAEEAEELDSKESSASEFAANTSGSSESYANANNPASDKLVNDRSDSNYAAEVSADEAMELDAESEMELSVDEAMELGAESEMALSADEAMELNTENEMELTAELRDNVVGSDVMSGTDSAESFSTDAANTEQLGLVNPMEEKSSDAYTSEEERKKKSALFKKGLHDLTMEELDMLTDEELQIFIDRQEVLDNREKNKQLEVVDEYEPKLGVQHKLLLTPLPEDEEVPVVKPKAKVKQTPRINFVEITSPGSDIKMQNSASKIWVQMKTYPVSLDKAKLTAQLWVNGRMVTSGKRSMLGLPSPKRGSHELLIKLVDKGGDVQLVSEPKTVRIR